MYQCPICNTQSNRRGKPFNSVYKVTSHIDGNHDERHDTKAGNEYVNQIIAASSSEDHGTALDGKASRPESNKATGDSCSDDEIDSASNPNRKTAMGSRDGETASGDGSAGESTPGLAVEISEHETAIPPASGGGSGDAKLDGSRHDSRAVSVGPPASGDAMTINWNKVVLLVVLLGLVLGVLSGPNARKNELSGANGRVD